MVSLLEARDLTFGYDADPLFTGWDASFSAGELVAITGPSGRGKSTLLYLLGLMVKPDRGTVLMSGHAVSDASDQARARLRATRFGFVFQDAALDATRSVLDNVVEGALYRREHLPSARRRGQALLEQFGVELRAAARPGQVSGGQAQRIALCRALLGDPAVVLADEPTGNLDPDSARTVMSALRERAHAGCSVVVVTHDPHVADLCDRSLAL